MRTSLRPALALLVMLPWLTQAALAVQPSERLDDPALEARARAISQELRCLVCQNQSIDDSDAGLARDLRLLVRERLAAGDSDEAVVAFIVDRYGEFVLLRPPVKPATYLLWLTPLILLLIGGWMLRRLFRQGPAALPPLTDAERAELHRRVQKDPR